MKIPTAAMSRCSRPRGVPYGTFRDCRIQGGSRLLPESQSSVDMCSWRGRDGSLRLVTEGDHPIALAEGGWVGCEVADGGDLGEGDHSATHRTRGSERESKPRGPHVLSLSAFSDVVGEGRWEIEPLANGANVVFTPQSHCRVSTWSRSHFSRRCYRRVRASGLAHIR